MRVKPKSTQRKRNYLLRLLAAAPLVASLSFAQQPTQPTTDTPSGSSAFQRMFGEPESQPQRPSTKTPLDIEKVLGSVAGSLARADDSVTPPTISPYPDASEPSTSEPETPFQVAGHPITAESTRATTTNIPAPITHGPYRGQLESYRVRAGAMDDTTRGSSVADGQVDFNMWWQDAMSAPLGLSSEALPIDVAGLTQTALVSSPYVQGLLTEPQIRRNDLVIADAEFDSLAFVEGKFADTHEPIGSALTAGGTATRFRDETFSSALGLRRKTRKGASLELVQRGGFQDNNSTFLVPNPQGTTRLEINFTQPLMKDRGYAVNNTRVLLAKIDVQLANSEVRSDLEDHLIDVTRAYWELYQARAEWLQRQRLLEGATKLHDILEARGEVDSLQRQILRAAVAVTSRRSDLVRAETRIRNAQARLRLLTGDPQLIQATRWELTPQDMPLAFPVDVSARQATITALDNRPDVAQAIRKIQAVAARVGAAKNQVLPRLDLILSTYVAGLDDDHNIFGAFENQFTEGRPSFAAGLLFEIPLGNRASRARLARNRWEMSRSLYEFQQTTEVAFTEVEVAVRETQTAFDEMVTKKQAIDAASREVSYLQQRWELLPDPNESAVLLIEDLLDAQERLADEERAFVRAQVDYALSWVQLRKAMGVLLRMENPTHSPLIANQPEPIQDAADDGAALR